jgi:hypothetical protein
MNWNHWHVAPIIEGLLFCDPLWEQALTIDIDQFLENYSLHDSTCLAVCLLPSTGAFAVIDWLFRRPGEQAYGAEPKSDPGDFPPGSTIPPRLVIRFDGFCQLRELISSAGSDEYWDDNVHSAESRRLREDEVEAWIADAGVERDPEDAMVRRLLDSTMCETIIRMVTGYQVRLLHSTPVRVLLVSSSGKLLPLPQDAPGSA